MPSTVIENNISLTKFEGIATAFNKYFVNISSKIQSNQISRNNFYDLFPNIDIIFLIKPVDKTDWKTILSLNPLKTVGRNSIPIKILKLLGNDISNQLSDMFNLSFSLVVFPQF